MRRGYSLSLACVATILVGGAHADADWQLVDTLATPGGGGGQVSVSLDISSIKQRQGVLTAWVRMNHTKPQRDAPNLPKYVSELHMFALDCDGERLAIVSSSLYDAKGNVVRTNSTPSPVLYSWQPIAPDTYGAKLLDRVCKAATQH